MFGTLPESTSRGRRSFLALVGSLLVHLALVTLAASQGVEARPLPPQRDTTILLLPLPPSDPRRTLDAGGRESSPDDAGRAPLAPIRAPALPVIPTMLPPIDSGAVFSDERNERLTEGARRTLMRGATDGAGSTGSPARDGLVVTGERGAVPAPGNPRPRYPSALRAAAVEGMVLAEFVIDTGGSIEMETVRIVESDHPLFEAAVREILPRLRFLPAEAGGVRVRQMVRLPFEFRLERDQEGA